MNVKLDDIRRLRTTADFISWFDETWDDLSATTEGRSYLRLFDGAAKVMREELFPTAIFLRHEPHRKEAEVVFPADNGQRDVVFFGFDEPEQVTNMEIVNAIDGYDDRLRTEFLEQHGRVSITGDIRRIKNTQGKRIIKTKFVAKLHKDTLAETRQLVGGAIEKKMSVGYDPSTWLLVAFDDGLFRKEGDYDYVTEVASSYPFRGIFERVYLVGKARGEACYRVF